MAFPLEPPLYFSISLWEKQSESLKGFFDEVFRKYGIGPSSNVSTRRTLVMDTYYKIALAP